MEKPNRYRRIKVIFPRKFKIIISMNKSLPVFRRIRLPRIEVVLLSEFKRTVLRFLYVTLLRKTAVHLIHVSKTGGTALQLALRKQAVTEKYALEFHTHPTRLRDIPVGEKVIFFLRDPVTRFTSGFYTRWRHGRNNSSWSPNEQRVFKKFDTPNKLATALSSDDLREKKSAIKAMRSIGHINKPIISWFESKDYFLSRRDDIFFIGFQESMSADFESLKAKLGALKSVELPTDDIKAHKTPAEFDRHLEDKAIENLKAWYAEDYEFIALCREVSERIYHSA